MNIKQEIKMETQKIIKLNHMALYPLINHSKGNFLNELNKRKPVISVDELEKKYWEKTRALDLEQGFITDGQVYEDLTNYESKTSLFFPQNSIINFTKDSGLSVITDYHTHPHREIKSNNFTKELCPPSSADLYYSNFFAVIAKDHSKKGISKIVEQFGVWEYFPNKIDPNNWFVDLNYNVRNEIKNSSLSQKEQIKQLKEFYETLNFTLNFKKFEN
jgi:hypothetical protein